MPVIGRVSAWSDSDRQHRLYLATGRDGGSPTCVGSSIRSTRVGIAPAGTNSGHAFSQETPRRRVIQHAASNKRPRADFSIAAFHSNPLSSLGAESLFLRRLGAAVCESLRLDRLQPRLRPVKSGLLRFLPKQRRNRHLWIGTDSTVFARMPRRFVHDRSPSHQPASRPGGTRALCRPLSWACFQVGMRSVVSTAGGGLARRAEVRLGQSFRVPGLCPKSSGLV